MLEWISQEPLRREWFFEQREGNCRLMGSFAVRLSETAPTWARALQAEKQRRHAAAVNAWNSSDKPGWLTEEVYREKIQPRLTAMTVQVISSALRISKRYAEEIRAGRQRPDPRHWLALARIGKRGLTIANRLTSSLTVPGG